MQLSDLPSRVFGVLDARLRPDLDAPLAIALSGGGDSLALLLLALDWADANGRRLLVLTVDHGLNRYSRQWTEQCSATAHAHGLAFEALAWTGPKPAAGLAAAARTARHRLLADAARKAGARVILMGHTGSDILEAGAMRALGSTTPDPKEWVPSPAWPEGRGVFLLRPLLALRRDEIRDWLTARGERWIDDPANADPASVRVQARTLTARSAPPDPPQAPVVALADACRLDPAGGIHLSRQALREASPDEARTFVALAAVCAGGGDPRPAAEKVDRLVRLLLGDSTLTTSLAGARIEANAADVAFYREPGEARRGGLTTLYLSPGQPQVWDGRFELTAHRAGLHVQRLAGLARKLGPAARRALLDIPAGARGALPVVVDGATAACPLLEEVPDPSVEGLVGPRLLAACGLVEREPA